MSRTAFALAAHPDDIEFVMAGTMMLLKETGYELHYMNLANGCCGSTVHDARRTAEIRRDEAREAAAQLGATFHESIVNDLEIMYDTPTLRRVASVMREVAPSIVLLHSPEDYMEDHMNACRLGVTAAFARGMPNYQVDPPRSPVASDVTLYHAQPHGNCDGVCRPVVPDFYINIESVIEAKEALLACHRSQKEWLDASQGMDSYLAAMRELSRQVGSLSGAVTYAEGWRRHSHLGFCSEDADPLSEALAEYRIGPSKD